MTALCYYLEVDSHIQFYYYRQTTSCSCAIIIINVTKAHFNIFFFLFYFALSLSVSLSLCHTTIQCCTHSLFLFIDSTIIMLKNIEQNEKTTKRYLYRKRQQPKANGIQCNAAYWAAASLCRLWLRIWLHM